MFIGKAVKVMAIMGAVFMFFGIVSIGAGSFGSFIFGVILLLTGAPLLIFSAKTWLTGQAVQYTADQARRGWTGKDKPEN